MPHAIILLKFSMLKSFIVSLFLLLAYWGHSADPYPRNNNIDVKHYRFQLELNDTTNIIEGYAEVTILFKSKLSTCTLDLAGKSRSQAGMSVLSVQWNETNLEYSHRNDLLEIKLNAEAGQEVQLKIHYLGMPADGLIIGRNKFGDRTFFGDNWPNRAHHWLPVIDHPYDKASCEFIVIAPNHYQVVANGSLHERTVLPNARMLMHWREQDEIPTKVMVIGVARFATQLAGLINGTPVETWVYPQNRAAGFHDFSIATQVLNYFVQQLGPFPFEKLANVQSTTRFGGMENAGAIFYFENSVTGRNERETLIAHEIAHQWFGDSATENDWHHVWLSEGFATYMASLYLEKAYGKMQLMQHMADQRDEVISYYKENPSPIIDTTIVNIPEVLNTNTYQKASWFLHMLRRQVGEQVFWEGIRSYYQKYQYKNALTDDFMEIMEAKSGINLQTFFSQWLYASGHPQLAATWYFHDRKKKLIIEIIQKQEKPFDLNLDIGIKNGHGNTDLVTTRLIGKKTVVEFDYSERPLDLVLDPQISLLFEGEIHPK